MDLWSLIGIWVAAFLTLSIYSVLYQDNPFYRFAEHLFVGVSVGYGIVLSIYQGFIPFAWDPFVAAVKGESPTGFIKLIPIGIGLLFFACLSARHTWLIRYPIAIVIGFGSGIAIPNVLRANIFEQTRGTIEPFAAIYAGTLSGWGHFRGSSYGCRSDLHTHLFFLCCRASRSCQMAFKGRHRFPHDRVRFGIRKYCDGSCRVAYSTG